jgi:hypothetical protein
MKKLLLAMGIGAGLAWLFDPDAGSRRREMLRQKLDEKGLTGAKPAAPASRPSTSYGDPTYDETSTGDVVPPSVASIP